MDRTANKGFSLTELLVAMTLGLIMGTGVITLFVNNRHSFDRDEAILTLQDDARQAIRALTSDLTMAGLWADLVLPNAVIRDGSLEIGTDCGPVGVLEWIYRTTVPLTGEAESLTVVDNATVATANAAYSCLGDEIVPGTDIVAVKRVAGARAPMALTDDTVYLRTNGTVGLLFQEPADVPPAIPVPAPFTTWEYRPSIYYVRNFAVVPGDGIPTLCRKILEFASPPTMETECLAQGIENLQIEIGLDSDADGNPDVYVTNPTIAQMELAVAAKIHLLARSAESDILYTDEKTYRLSNAPDYAPNDNFYRRVFSMIIGLRNLQALRILTG